MNKGNELKDLICIIYMFKRKGHRTWRVSQDMHGVDETQITERKTIFVDRLTGKIEVK